MRIATWNVERLKHLREISKIRAACAAARSDILVLTESDERLQPDFQYNFITPTPPDLVLSGRRGTVRYGATEHRVAVYTNYPPVKLHPTFDAHTALCVELKTEEGNLLVYGTIIGVLGNRDPSFAEALRAQLEDFARLSALGNLCICGDYNCSFADSYYFTESGRNSILQAFENYGIEILTANVPRCVDHIAVSKSMVQNRKVSVWDWNTDRTLSDHQGVAVQLHGKEKSRKGDLHEAQTE